MGRETEGKGLTPRGVRSDRSGQCEVIVMSVNLQSIVVPRMGIEPIKIRSLGQPLTQRANEAYIQIFSGKPGVRQEGIFPLTLLDGRGNLEAGHLGLDRAYASRSLNVECVI